MLFNVELTKNAREDYLALDARWRAAIKAALETHLRREPTKESKSRIKRLRDVIHPEYRLRVDEYRVFYDVTDNLVMVLGIVEKGHADEWLKNFTFQTDDDSSPE